MDKEDIQKLISETKANHKPFYSYSELDNEGLIIALCVMDFQGLQCVIRISGDSMWSVFTQRFWRAAKWPIAESI